MKTTRIVLADDHPYLRASLMKLLQNIPWIQVIGEAENGVEAVRLVNSLTPDVLLIDIDMPLISGLEVIQQLCAANPPVHILVLSTYQDQYYVRGLLDMGAAGYLSKDEVPGYIAEAIRRIARGETGWFTQKSTASGQLLAS